MKQSEALTILKSGKNVFLTGEPGSGKTYTINLFRDWLMENNIPFELTASTGIAATHIGGTTIHSFASTGIKDKFTKADIDKIQQNFFKVATIQRPRVLIIDEVSMLDAKFMEKLNYIMTEIRRNDKPFGGVQLIVVGDFFQLPPVVKGTDEDPHPETFFAFESEVWKDAEFQTCYLTEQHRASEPVFIDILTRMRNGRLEEADLHQLLSRGKDVTYDNLLKEPELHLYTHNVDVDRKNALELEKVTGELYENCTFTEGIPFMKQLLIRQMMSPFKLQLKIGASVMFTRNNFEEGYVNGTLGHVIAFEGRNPIVETLGGDVIEVFKTEWTIEQEGKVKARAVQYPLRLGYAVTVHKSQGMSLDAAKIDLSKVFEYGQGYVAVSRVRSLQGLDLSGASIDSFNMHPKVIEYDKLIRKKTVMEEVVDGWNEQSDKIIQS